MRVVVCEPTDLPLVLGLWFKTKRIRTSSAISTTTTIPMSATSRVSMRFSRRSTLEDWASSCSAGRVATSTSSLTWRRVASTGTAAGSAATAAGATAAGSTDGALTVSAAASTLTRSATGAGREAAAVAGASASAARAEDAFADLPFVRAPCNASAGSCSRDRWRGSGAFGRGGWVPAPRGGWPFELAGATGG